MAGMERFTQRARRVISLAHQEAEQSRNNKICTEHLLLALINEEGGVAGRVLRELGMTPDRVREVIRRVTTSSPNFDPNRVELEANTQLVLEHATDEARRLGHHYIGTEHILLGLVRVDSTAMDVLRRLGVTAEQIRRQTRRVLNESASSSVSARAKTPLMDQLSEDLTNRAQDGAYDFIVGRESEIYRLTQILSRRLHNNPIIVGNPGVGKTSMVYGLARKIIKGAVSPILFGKRILTLDLFDLAAGTSYRGQYEERIKRLIAEATSNNVILFIDNLGFALRNSYDRSTNVTEVFDMLYDSIARGEVKVIGAINTAEYDQFTTHPIFISLNRFFIPLYISELPVEETISLMKAQKRLYELHHHIQISDDAIEAAVRLSDRLIRDQYQPEKSLVILDDAAASLAVSQSNPLGQAMEEVNKLKETRLLAQEEGDSEQVRDIEEKIIEIEEDIEKRINNFQHTVVLDKEKIIESLAERFGVSTERIIDEKNTITDLLPLTQNEESSVSTENLRLGEKFKQKYKALKLLGAGGYGDVWKVENVNLHRFEAVKVLHFNLLQSRRFIDRFYQEARLAAKLRHQNIITIYSIEESENSEPYITMEYVDGPSLAQVVDLDGSLPVEKVVILAIQICRALEYAHENQVIHRDIKPGNILLDGGNIKITDFGISVLAKDLLSETTGIYAGTPLYKAPEQIQGKKIDQRTDIYSLGATLYELLTGEPPFQGSSTEYQHVNELPLPPSYIKRGIPPSIDQIILKCLSKNPLDRYRTAAELREAVENVPSPIPVTPLTNLMKAKNNNQDPPYNLILGKNTSIYSGCSSITQLVDGIVREMGGDHKNLLPWSEKLTYFYRTLERLSDSERYNLLKRHYQGVEPSIGYMNLARLIKAGYFDVIFTTNIDRILEQALNNVGVSVGEYSVINVGDKISNDFLRESLAHRTPRIKIVKLHGDLLSRRFAFTPQEIFEYNNNVKNVIAEYFCKDLLIVGLEKRDEDLLRLIETEDNGIWLINPDKLPIDFLTSQFSPIGDHTIWGDNAYFDRFFTLLADELIPE